MHPGGDRRDGGRPEGIAGAGRRLSGERGVLAGGAFDLKTRGLTVNPQFAIGDGALGFWKALPQVFGTTRGQRCWVHKTANVLNKLPKSQQPKAKAALHEI